MGLRRPVHNGNTSQHAIRTTSRTSLYLLYCCTLPVFLYWLPDGNTSQDAIRASFHISLHLTFMYFTVFTLLLYFTTVFILTTWWQHQPTRNSRDFTNLSLLYIVFFALLTLLLYLTKLCTLLYVLHFTYFTAVLYHSLHTAYLLATQAATQPARPFIPLSTWLSRTSLYWLYSFTTALLYYARIYFPNLSSSITWWPHWPTRNSRDCTKSMI